MLVISVQEEICLEMHEEGDIMVELTGEGIACISVGLTKTWDGLVIWIKCVWKVEEKTLTWPGQPRTCSHPIYARMLTGVCQVVR